MDSLHEETSKIGKKYFVRWHTPWLEGGIFCCYKFWHGIKQSIFIIKNEQTKQDMYLDETNKKSGNYCK